jgi:O-antigen/teichoic acid export membrane protein
VSGDGLKARALRGASWTIAGFGVGQVIRLVSNVLLARLLFPEAFGLMAMVTVFNNGLQMFSDVGIGPALVQHPRGREPSFLRTAWTVQVVRGAALALIGISLALPASRILGMPDLAPMLAVASLGALISGFVSTRWYVAHRELELGRITAIELVSQVFVVVVSVGLAIIWRSPWVLVIGLLCSNAVKVLLTHLTLKGEADRFGFEWTRFLEMMGIGRWIFLNTAIGFFARNLDRIYIGICYSEAILGVYAIAFRFIDILQSIVLKLYDRILFPGMSEALRGGDRLQIDRYFRFRRYAMGAWSLVVVAAFLTGDLLIDALYDDRYRDAQWILRVGSLSLWPMALTQSTSNVMLAAGKPRFFVLGSAARLLSLAVLLPLASSTGGLAGTVALIAFADVFRYVGLAFGARVTGVLRWRDDLFLTIWFLLLWSAGAWLRPIQGISIELGS